MRFFAWLSFGLLLVAGCETTEVTVDGGPGVDAGGTGTGMLTLLSEPSAALVTGETATVSVRYTEAGNPVAGTELRFALIGTAHDSAVQDLTLTTGMDGRAETLVTAGTIAAAFRVRASGGGAEPVFVNVAVSTEGFGTLRAIPEYAGRRGEAATRVFRVYSDTECDPDDGYPTFADRSLMVEADEDVEARWSLPVGLSYTVVAEFRSNDAVVASGCVDDVTLTADAETEATVVLTDEALVPDGRFTTQLELRPGTAGTSVIEHALLGGRDAVGDSGASWFLDALDAELRERGKTETADRLVGIRETQEATLQTALGEVALGPLEAINRLGTRLEAQLAVVALRGPVTLSSDAEVLGGVWTLDDVAVGPVGPDSPMPLRLDVTTLTDPMPRLELTWRPEADVVDLDALSLTLRLGALLAAVLDAEAGTSEPGAMLADGAGCDALAAWIEGQAELTPDCGADCAAAVCTRALAPLEMAIRDRLRGDEALRDAVTLSGTLAVADADADILVDRIEGRGLTGEWSGLEGSDAITADLVGDRLLE